MEGIPYEQVVAGHEVFLKVMQEALREKLPKSLVHRFHKPANASGPSTVMSEPSDGTELSACAPAFSRATHESTESSGGATLGVGPSGERSLDLGTGPLDAPLGGAIVHSLDEQFGDFPTRYWRLVNQLWFLWRGSGRVAGWLRSTVLPGFLDVGKDATPARLEADRDTDSIPGALARRNASPSLSQKRAGSSLVTANR
jgi:hypothetical protein